MNGEVGKYFMQGPVDEGDLLTLSGSVEDVIFSNRENGYAICELGLEPENELVTITGTLPYVEEGDLLTVHGSWVHNPKYGRQFKVESFEKTMPVGADAIRRYLASGNIRGIGPKTAQRIVDKFGDETFDVMENHPEWLADIPGITHKRAHEISDEFRRKAGIRAAMLFFSDFFGGALIVRIYEKYHGAAIEIAKHTPYRFCEEISGIGFEKADRMAQKLGFGKEELPRVCSGILYILSDRAAQDGHLCLPKEELIRQAAQLLEVDPSIVETALGQLEKDRRLIADRRGETVFFYEKSAYENERYIAKKLLLLNRLCPAVDTANISSLIDKEEKQSGIEYAGLQRRAIVLALESGVMLLTGGPGTGKTTVVRALLHIFQSMDARVSLCAPTGRAAKRLSESTSCEAKTIHRLLLYGPGENGVLGFGRNEKNLLDEDVIIADEASMIDNQLMSALCEAIKPGARLILIGDSDQLPSVGAGNILRDLIASECFATVRLTEIFRQAKESLIVTGAHAINRGEMPRLDAKDKDFFFLAREDDGEILSTVRELCKTRLPRTYGEIAESGTQVICPSRKGKTGTDSFNGVLQESLNPPSHEKAEYRFRDQIFREGDRVMQTKNDYMLEWKRDDGAAGFGIFNGDIGVILSIDKRSEKLQIRFDERTVFYDFSLLENLSLAYAITVHKSQGSEYPIVILPLGSTPPMLLFRNLLYTAVTRAQLMVILVGRSEFIRKMVENNQKSLRYTGLAERLGEFK
ncbi:MAG: ATP-dependent RecD-like DNA helicase [Clostridia bacterium]|nr:ATP-dependent RecD-like DNA helicase [Clostridia bacterium]